MADQPERDLARPFNPGDHAPFGEVEKYLGKGASGFVFLTVSEGVHRAVKVYDRWAVAEPGAPERLRRETTTLSTLNHTGICRAYSSGSVIDKRDSRTELHYLVMEYVDGRDLEACVKAEGPMAVERAIDVTLAIADALEQLHAKGVVHRDIKPANVMLESGTSRVVVMDFGVSRNGADDTVTQTGAFLGTTQFAAPEWIYRLPGADATSTALDVYSLGATLLFLLSGEKPFPGVLNYAQLLDIIRTQPPTTTYPIIPQWLRLLILSMMSKEPKDRPSLPEVKQALFSQRHVIRDAPAVKGAVTVDSVRTSMAQRVDVIERVQSVGRTNQIAFARQQFSEHLSAIWAPFIRGIEDGEAGQGVKRWQINFGDGIGLERFRNAGELRERFRGFEFDTADCRALIWTPIAGVTVALMYYLAGGPSSFSVVVFVAQLLGHPAGDIDVATARISSGDLQALMQDAADRVAEDGQLLVEHFVKANP